MRHHRKPISLGLLAEKIGAKLVDGQQDFLISGIASLSHAQSTEVSFFTNRKYHQDLIKTKASAVILSEKDQAHCSIAKLIMANPYFGYAQTAAILNPPATRPVGIHPSAWVSPDAKLADQVSIGPQAVVEAGVVLEKGVVVGAGCVIDNDVIIGAHTQLVANVTVCSNTYIGKRVIIHPGAVIGSDGFGLANNAGEWVKIPQLGGVIISDDVEIGANTTIDKGALENTVIEKGVKLDNLIQIGHNVKIGEHTAIAGCVGIAGSTRIGRYCTIAGGVGIVGHIELVDNVQVTGGSIVLQSITKPGVYSSGTPLESNQHWHRNYHRFKQLDDITKRLHALEQQIDKQK